MPQGGRAEFDLSSRGFAAIYDAQNEEIARVLLNGSVNRKLLRYTRDPVGEYWDWELLVTPVPAPEPATWHVAGIGLLAIGVGLRRRRRQSRN